MAPADPSSARPRLLLVEDDDAIRQFVCLALEELPIDVQGCASLAEARSALLQPPTPFLILLDLMLPDGRGQDLLSEPAVRAAAGPATWVVFSAGVHDSARRTLEALGVAEVLRKPVALADLLRCVGDRIPAAASLPLAAGDSGAPGVPPGWVDGEASGPDVSADSPALEDGSPAAVAQAIEQYFDGQAPLFDAMARLSLARLPADEAALAAALQTADVALARRLAHNLRSVLRMLGRPNAAHAAETLEAALAAQPLQPWETAWQALTEGLRSNRQAADMP